LYLSNFSSLCLISSFLSFSSGTRSWLGFIIDGLFCSGYSPSEIESNLTILPNDASHSILLGAEIINFDEEDPVERIKKETNGRGVICIDAVGYEAVGHASSNSSNKGEDSSNYNYKKGHDHSKVSNPAYEPSNPLQIINWMCQAARKYSTISIPGVYGSAYDQFPLGQLFQRELQIRMGQCPVKKYNEQLLHLIEVGRIDATKIISHPMKLDEAPKRYEMFDKKEDVTKVVFKP
jgi:S-(hydroxymethyl)glutathione dehydrogenase / alcohol dehydrogenase